MTSLSYVTFFTIVKNVIHIDTFSTIVEKVIYSFDIFFIFSFLWLIVITKKLLFWMKLWQLKEYHIGRFLDYFHTQKGKSSIFNLLNIAKIITIFGLIFFFPVFVPILFLIFLIESCFIFYRILRANLTLPVLTKKTTTLLIAGIFLEIFLLFLARNLKNFQYFTISLIIFDFLAPVIFSFWILSFQPLTVILRNRIIKKAKLRREKFKDLIVVGIVGSYGKTSTKEFLVEILSEKFKVLKTKEHQNSEIGIAQCILKELKEEHQIFVVEMGAYGKDWIKFICDFVKPKMGIITGINEQHLALFGSMKNLISAEGGLELIESLPEDGVVIFNGNNEFCREIYDQTNLKKRIVATNLSIFQTIVKNIDQIDLRAEDIKLEKEFISFKVFSKEGDFADFRVNVLGTQNIENILLAITLAKELGMSLKEIAKACEKIKQEQGAMKLFKIEPRVNIIDSTYSANPNGVLAHLEYLKLWPQKKIIIMPCLIELGSASKEIHKKIGQKIGQVCDLAIITTKDKFKEIKQGAIEKGMKKNNILFLENPKEILKKIKEFCKEGDVILLEGRIPKKIIEFLYLKETIFTKHVI